MCFVTLQSLDFQNLFDSFSNNGSRPAIYTSALLMLSNIYCVTQTVSQGEHLIGIYDRIVAYKTA